MLAWLLRFPAETLTVPPDLEIELSVRVGRYIDTVKHTFELHQLGKITSFCLFSGGHDNRHFRLDDNWELINKRKQCEKNVQGVGCTITNN